jgi:hypothetical protein
VLVEPPVMWIPKLERYWGKESANATSMASTETSSSSATSVAYAVVTP